MRNKHWWNKFFEKTFSRSYLRRDEKTLRQIIDFLVTNLHLKKNSRVFDQCSGTGEIAHALAQQGIKVVGVDQSKTYVHEAKEKAKKNNLSCEFYAGDAFYFKPKGYYDAAINWYTSFGYSCDDNKNIKMLRCAYKSLKRGGYFALDYYNTASIIKNFKPLMSKRLKIGKIMIKLIRVSKIDLEKGMLLSRWIYKYANNKAKELHGETRLYLPVDLKRMFLEVGFKKIKFYGTIKMEKLTINSPRCIIVGKK